jgi:hypothetical protein
MTLRPVPGWSALCSISGARSRPALGTRHFQVLVHSPLFLQPKGTIAAAKRTRRNELAIAFSLRSTRRLIQGQKSILLTSTVLVWSFSVLSSLAIRICSVLCCSVLLVCALRVARAAWLALIVLCWFSTHCVVARSLVRLFRSALFPCVLRLVVLPASLRCYVFDVLCVVVLDGAVVGLRACTHSVPFSFCFGRAEQWQSLLSWRLRSWLWPALLMPKHWTAVYAAVHVI